MKPMTIVWTETKRHLKLTFALIVTGLCLGAGSHFAILVQDAIRNFAKPVPWNVDLAILPKGVGLDDLAQEILSGHSKAVIPEVMFETTRDIVKDALEMNAIMVTTGPEGVEVLSKSKNALGVNWALGQVQIKPWREQHEVATEEWGDHVIVAAFARGNEQNIYKLKDLIDRKTVAQAYRIADVNESVRHKSEQLGKLATLVDLILGVALAIAIWLAVSWLYTNHLETRTALKDLGFGGLFINAVTGVLMLSLTLLPFVVGFLAMPRGILHW